jgi:hypothetical protein
MKGQGGVSAINFWLDDAEIEERRVELLLVGRGHTLSNEPEDGQNIWLRWTAERQQNFNSHRLTKPVVPRIRSAG